MVTAPINIKVFTPQITNLQSMDVTGRGAYAYIDGNTGKLVSVSQDLGQVVIGMGNEKGIISKEVAEFTVVSASYSHAKYIIKNYDGLAREVLVKDNSVTYGEIKSNIGKVIGGRMIPFKDGEYVVADGAYIPLLKNGALDEILTGDGTTRSITLNNSDANIKKQLKGYVLKSDNKLYKDSTLVSDNVVDIGYFVLPHASPISVGVIGKNNDSVMKQVAGSLLSYGVDSSYTVACRNYADKLQHPTGKVSGADEVFYDTTKTVKEVGGRAIGGKGILVYKTNGSLYLLNEGNNSLSEQKVRRSDDKGFNALYVDNDTKMVIFNNNYKYSFSESEVGKISSYIFQ